MATTEWLEFWGAYDNTGPYNNVVLGGSESDSGPYGIALATAHSSGVGYGIKFTDNGNYSVTFNINLCAYAVTDSGTWVSGGHYVHWAGNYNYILVISVSNNGGASYRDIYNQVVFSHPSTWYMAYAGNWLETAQNSQWNGTLTIPTDTTHVRIELKGEDVTFPHYNVFSIEQIITEYMPWAVRKGGQFKSLDNPTGWFKIRKSNKWKATEKMTEKGKANEGNARIRQSGTWVGQGKIGN